MGKYKVSVRPLEGEEVIVEYFDDKGEAETFMASLLTEDDSNIINTLPYPMVNVDFSELCLGTTWVLQSRKLLIR